MQGAVAIGAAFGAIETMAENLALELGIEGVRAVCLRITANVNSRTIQQTMELSEQAKAHIANLNFLKTPMSVEDTAKAAVLLASDSARFMTGTVVNSSAGAALD